MTHQTRLAFLWHMHQPGYLNLDETELELPWVRLHCTKSYFDMAWMLSKHPNIQCTINFVPILLEQIQRYLDGMRDRYFFLSMKPTSQLNHEEKQIIREKFFSCSFETCVASRPRYLQLHEKAQSDIGFETMTTQDFRDLIVLFNLSWFGYGCRSEYPLINRLELKSQHFDEDEKRKLLDIQIAAMQRIFPMYRALIAKKQIEISTTPYHHPILPLILDSDVMGRCMPDRPRPSRYRSPSDAFEHVSRAVEAYEKIFGHRPVGMWPAEGSISPEAIELINGFEFKWAVSDEAILWKSLGDRAEGRGDLYRPYMLSDHNTRLFFRDRDLSDAVGFRYARMNTDDGVESFMTQVHQMAEHRKHGHSPLIVVALDGENPWEYYHNDGFDFLNSLYERLADDASIRTVRLCDALDGHGELSELATGSWIDGDFSVWIGGDTENKAWNLLGDATEAFRRVEAKLTPTKRAEALRFIHRAQSSDWFWWYGDRFESADDADFDALFRGLLRGVYVAIGSPIPDAVNTPLVVSSTENEIRPPKAFINPEFALPQTPIISWLDGGLCLNRTGSMANTGQLFGNATFGFDENFLYFRIAAKQEVVDKAPPMALTIIVEPTVRKTITVNQRQTLPSTDTPQFARLIDGAIEGFLLRSTIEMHSGKFARFRFEIEVEPSKIESVPITGFITTTVPSVDFALSNWNA